MQQAYRALRVVSEAQTIRMVLSPQPDELLLSELIAACTAVPVGPAQQGSDGIKAVVLEFKSSSTPAGVGDALKAAEQAPANLEQARNALLALAPPVLAVVRVSLSSTASSLAYAADLILAAHDAMLTITDPASQHDRLAGEQAARLGYVTWSASPGGMDREMTRILDMLRDKSAIALRHAKTSVRLGIEPRTGQKSPGESNTPAGSQVSEPQKNTQQAASNGASPLPSSLPSKSDKRLEALKQVNDFYLDQVMRTEDAQEGLHAFLEKRKAKWKNR